MLPAQESAISESTHFTGGQVSAFPMPSFCSPTRLYETVLSISNRCVCTRSYDWLDGQVLLPSGPVPKLEQFGGGVMHQATPPAKRPPLPSLDIPGAPCGTHMHVPHSTAHVVSTCCHLL